MNDLTIACGLAEGTGPKDRAPIVSGPRIPVARVSDEITMQDKDGDNWTAVIGWTSTRDGRIAPTTIVLQSDTGKTVTRGLLACLPIADAVAVAREQVEEFNAIAREWAAQPSRHTGVTRKAPAAPQDGPKRPGRPTQYGEEFHRLVAAAWLADTGGNRGITTRIGDVLWDSREWPGIEYPSFLARVRKAVRTCMDPDNPWGFIAQAQSKTNNR